MLESAVEHYRLNVGTLPGTLDDLRCPPVDPDTRLRWAGPYLTQPAPFDPWGKAYRYQLLTPTNFKITSAGGDGLWLTADDIDPAAE
jgi:general secretion pathway protein G